MKPRKNLSISRKDFDVYFGDIEILLEGLCEELKDEISSSRSDIQGQLQDIYNELRLLRREMNYRQFK